MLDDVSRSYKPSLQPLDLVKPHDHNLIRMAGCRRGLALLKGRLLRCDSLVWLTLLEWQRDWVRFGSGMHLAHLVSDGLGLLHSPRVTFHRHKQPGLRRSATGHHPLPKNHPGDGPRLQQALLCQWRERRISRHACLHGLTSRCDDEVLGYPRSALLSAAYWDAIVMTTESLTELRAVCP